MENFHSRYQVHAVFPGSLEAAARGLRFLCGVSNGKNEASSDRTLAMEMNDASATRAVTGVKGGGVSWRLVDPIRSYRTRPDQSEDTPSRAMYGHHGFMLEREGGLPAHRLN